MIRSVYPHNIIIPPLPTVPQCQWWQRCGRDYCDAKMVMSAADAMATNGMKEAGYEYIIISGER